jgi:Helix-turn-helix domain
LTATAKPTSRRRGTAAAWPTYLTTDEVSAIIRTPASTLRYWRRNGAGPRATLVGTRYLYDEQDVRAFLADCPTVGVPA